MGERILAIDQGTTGSTCLVLELAGQGSGGGLRLVGRGYAELPQHFPNPGWVEHDLEEIWDTTQAAMREALAVSETPPSKLAGIGITNQRETTGIWDVAGRPVQRALVWQDRRTADRCRRLRDGGHETLIRERTGLVIDPYFSGTKLAWFLEEVPGLRSRASHGELRFGTIDSWLVWKLTGGRAHVTDATNASRTMLFDILQNRWDEDLCGLLGEIPASLLPTVVNSSGVIGCTHGVPGVPDGIPIAGVAGDQQAALFGQACFVPGMAKCTYGTGAFVLVNTGDRAVASKHGLITTVAWRLADRSTYAIEGSTFVAGAVVQWLRDGLGLIASSSEIEGLARQVPDSGGVMFVPALTGLGAPHWRPEARGLISGLTRGTTGAHLARAALDGIALQIQDVIAVMQTEIGYQVPVMRVDGGACANNLLMQVQADLLGIDLHRPRVVDTTAMGAAFLACLGLGLFANLEEVASTWQAERVFRPEISSEQAQVISQRWHDAVDKA